MPERNPEPSLDIVRARTIIPLCGELPARGMASLNAPFAALDDGVIVARNGVILAVEPFRDFRRRVAGVEPTALRDLGDALLAPGFVNCHTHLELSHLAGKTVGGKGFLPWVQSLVALDGKEKPDEPPAALDNAVHAMARAGTSAVVDTTGRRPEAVLAALGKAGITPRPCLEIIGHDPAVRDMRITQAEHSPAFSLAAHALYSTPGETAVAARAWCEAKKRPFSIHLAEHADEVTFLTTGKGPFAQSLHARLVPQDWRAPMRRPVRYAHDLGLLAPGTIAVHCVQCDRDEVALLAASGAALCLCPRSNSYIGVGEAPLRHFMQAGALLTLGTDSLASNNDLNIWNDSEYFLQKNLAPPNALLRMLTVNGASAAMLSGDVGSLETGKQFCYSVFPRDAADLFRFA